MAEVLGSQSPLLGVIQQDAASRATQVVLQAVYAPPSTKQAVSTQESLQIAYSAGSNNVATNITQLALLASYKDAAPGTARQQAWTFVLDGHRFIVFPLGPEGDWAYDTTTKEWTQLQTQGFEGLNFSNGVMWGIRIFGGDTIYPVLGELDPNQRFDDGWRSIQRIATGGVATRARSNVGVANFSVVASVNDVDLTGETINLSFSDDNGSTWSQDYPIVLNSKPTQKLIWNALGSFATPGRIFRVTDSAGPVRLDGADIVLNYSSGADSGTDQDQHG